MVHHSASRVIPAPYGHAQATRESSQIRGSYRAVPAVMVLACAAALAACSSNPPPSAHSQPASSTTLVSPAAGHRRPTSRTLVLRASLAGWHLAQPVSREVVLADGDRLDVVGGLAATGATTSGVTSIDPDTGRWHPSQVLSRATHDAGGALVGGHELVFGGGSASSQRWIQRRSPGGRWSLVGDLPTPRSDLSAVAVADSAYLVGGYDGRRLQSEVLKLSPAGRVQVVGRLPVPVRYPAVAVADGAIWVIGGRGRSGPVADVQRFDPATGRGWLAGRLPAPVQGASAVALGGQIYVCGGATRSGPTAQIVRVDPSTGHIARAGRLPLRVSYAGAATLGGTGYLVGGETPAASRDVIVLRLVGASRQGTR